MPKQNKHINPSNILIPISCIAIDIIADDNTITGIHISSCEINFINLFLLIN